MVWGFAGKGLRTTVSLEGFYDKVLANFLQINIGNLSIPTGTLLFFALLAFLMWAFLHTKTGTAMTAVGSNPTFAKAAGVNVDKMRMLSVIMSTWLAAVGILVYEQGFGFIQIYTAPFYMALPPSPPSLSAAHRSTRRPSRMSSSVLFCSRASSP